MILTFYTVRKTSTEVGLIVEWVSKVLQSRRARLLRN